MVESAGKPPRRLVAIDFRIAPVLKELRRAAGTDEDIVVAQRLGILPRDVAEFRQRHGIPVFGSALWYCIDDVLGLYPDKEIAAQLGVDVTTVSKRRRKLGIHSYRRNEPVLTGKCDRALGLPISDEKAADWLGVQIRTIRARRAWLKKVCGEGE